MLSENAITGYCFIKLSEYRFNAWSLSCNCTGRSYGNVPADFFVFRGYTGHEHIDVFNLINMNGRVYDPLLGIFLSPDNYVQMPDATQGFNRYAYCFNNPLKYTDPSGEIVIQLLGFAISYIIQQLHPQSLNSYIPNYYQNRSSLIGFGVGALVNCFIPGANGLIKGAILGGLSGGLSGGITAGIDALLSGGNFGDAFSKGFSSGLLSGMITGGIKGGLTARQYGLNILTGEPRNNMNDLIVMASLERPDFDGYLTLKEANYWYRNGNGQSLTVDLNKIDLSGIHTEDFPDGVGSTKSFNLLIHSGSYNDGMVYGNITLKLYPNNMVRAFPDVYDFDMHPWINPLNWPRNVETIFGSWLAGDGNPYTINFRGSAYITTTHHVIK